MMNNIYFLYAVVMLLILTAMTSMIWGANSLVTVAHNLIARDWRYRRRVLAAASVVVALFLAVLIHWLSTSPD